MLPRTVIEKIWDDHLVTRLDGQEDLLFIDREIFKELIHPS